MVSRIVGNITVRVSTIERTGNTPVFKYASEYLAQDNAIPLSLSLPLEERAYGESELRSYFEGLIPEGRTREELAARAAASEEDYLALLEFGGLDCVGDVVVRGAQESDDGWETGDYVPLTSEELALTLHDYESLSRSNAESRLSLAGTQGKVGLAHDPHAAMDAGWLLPVKGPPSTHILKINGMSLVAEFEAICMMAAGACGLRVARTE